MIKLPKIFGRRGAGDEGQEGPRTAASIFEDDEYITIPEEGDAEEGGEAESAAPSFTGISYEGMDEEEPSGPRFRLPGWVLPVGGGGTALLLLLGLGWWIWSTGVLTTSVGGPQVVEHQMPEPVPEGEIEASRQEAVDVPQPEEPAPARPEEEEGPPAISGDLAPGDPGAGADKPRQEPLPEPPLFTDLARVAAEGRFPLTPAPAEGLSQSTAEGLLPKTGPEGRTPWEVYGRPYDWRSGLPRVAVVLTGMGRTSQATDAAMERMPAAVTLAYSPYLANLKEAVARARENGREVILELPLEPRDYPVRDPGHLTLLSFLPASENRRRLVRIMSAVPGYVGLLTRYGTAYLEQPPEKVEWLLDELAGRGVGLVPGARVPAAVSGMLAGMGLPTAPVRARLAVGQPREALTEQLEMARTAAERDGRAVVLVEPVPAAYIAVREWVERHHKVAFELTPVSTLFKP